jgi:hypothetical protein
MLLMCFLPFPAFHPDLQLMRAKMQLQGYPYFFITHHKLSSTPLHLSYDSTTAPFVLPAFSLKTNMETENIELDALSSNVAGRNNSLLEQNFEPVEEYDRALPRADGGKDAWLFLAACFMVEALVCTSSDSKTLSKGSE